MRLDKENFVKRKSNAADEKYRVWKIWYWDENDKKHTLYIKQKELDDVVKFCRLKGITKYSIFDDKFKNRCNDGKRTLV